MAIYVSSLRAVPLVAESNRGTGQKGWRRHRLEHAGETIAARLSPACRRVSRFGGFHAVSLKDLALLAVGRW